MLEPVETETPEPMAYLLTKGVWVFLGEGGGEIDRQAYIRTDGRMQADGEMGGWTDTHPTHFTSTSAQPPPHTHRAACLLEADAVDGADGEGLGVGQARLDVHACVCLFRGWLVGFGGWAGGLVGGEGARGVYVHARTPLRLYARHGQSLMHSRIDSSDAPTLKRKPRALTAQHGDTA